MVCLLNTHLESTKDFSDERVNQLNQVFNYISKVATNESVLFAGDLNLRDNEVIDSLTEKTLNLIRLKGCEN